MTGNTQASNLHSLRALQTEGRDSHWLAQWQAALFSRVWSTDQKMVTELCALRRVLPCSPTRALDSIRELREEGVSRRGSEIRRGWPRYGPLRTAKRRVCGA
mgnify:FL=1